MPRITRKQQKVFAADASNNGVFGSLQANDPTYSQDPDAIQGRTAYSNGWNDATYSAEKLPPLEEFQSLQYLFSRQIAYLMQDGIPEWNSATTYYKGALVKAIQSDGSFILYASLIDDNTNNLVTDTTKWVITNTSTNFHQGIPNWRADVVYSAGDWVKALNDGTWSIFESKQNNNLNNAITNTSYWEIKPFTSKLPLLWHSWFDHELDDVSWLRADTFSWQDGTAYEDVYDHLVDDYTNGTSQTETVGSYTITYVLSADGHKITTDETTVQNIYNATGVAWYYILDTTNQRFKLPRENPNKEKIVSLTQAPVVGNGSAMYFNGITNSDEISTLKVYTNQYSGDGTLYLNASPSSGNTIGLSKTASKSGLVAKLDSSTSSSYYKGDKYLYFYVGQFTQTATEQTAGLNTELFNGKLDLDMGNATSSTKQTIVGWGMPNYSAGISIPVPKSSTPYTAPYNGVYKLCYENKSALSNKYLTVNGVSVYRYQYSSGANPGWLGSIELKKGDVLSSNVNDAPTTVFYSVFYPCIGG